MYRITLDVDDLDYDAIQKAMARRQTFRVMPDGVGNLTGRTIAEICRGWLDFMDERPASDYLDNDPPDSADWWKADP